MSSSLSTAAATSGGVNQQNEPLDGPGAAEGNGDNKKGINETNRDNGIDTGNDDDDDDDHNEGDADSKNGPLLLEDFPDRPVFRTEQPNSAPSGLARRRTRSWDHLGQAIPDMMNSLPEWSSASTKRKDETEKAMEDALLKNQAGDATSFGFSKRLVFTPSSSEQQQQPQQRSGGGNGASLASESVSQNGGTATNRSATTGANGDRPTKMKQEVEVNFGGPPARRPRQRSRSHDAVGNVLFGAASASGSASAQQVRNSSLIDVDFPSKPRSGAIDVDFPSKPRSSKEKIAKEQSMQVEFPTSNRSNMEDQGDLETSLGAAPRKTSSERACDAASIGATSRVDSNAVATSTTASTTTTDDGWDHVCREEAETTGTKTFRQANMTTREESLSELPKQDSPKPSGSSSGSFGGAWGTRSFGTSAFPRMSSTGESSGSNLGKLAHLWFQQRANPTDSTSSLHSASSAQSGATSTGSGLDGSRGRRLLGAAAAAASPQRVRSSIEATAVSSLSSSQTQQQQPQQRGRFAQAFVGSLLDGISAEELPAPPSNNPRRSSLTTPDEGVRKVRRESVTRSKPSAVERAASPVPPSTHSTASKPTAPKQTRAEESAEGTKQVSIRSEALEKVRELYCGASVVHVDPYNMSSGTVLGAEDAVLNSNSAPPSPTDAASPNYRGKENGMSFSSDSPYFATFVEKEVRSLAVLKETMKDISSRATTFGRCGILMAEATRRLSQACKLHPTLKENANGDEFREEEAMERDRLVVEERREAVGTEMEGVLSVLGEVLEEVASAQLQMCESLEASIGMTLEAFANNEYEEVSTLKSEAETIAESAEASFAKYLHGRYSERATTDGDILSKDAASSSASFVQNAQQLQNVAAQWNKLSDQVGSQIGSTIQKWSRSGELAPSVVRRAGRNDRSQEKDPSMAHATAAANLRQNLEHIRLAHSHAELKRFQLWKKLDLLKTRRNFELGESTLASLHGIRAYFHHCSDMMQGLTPRLQSLQAAQAKSRQQHDVQQESWRKREAGLTQTVEEVGIAAANAGVIADAISRGQATGLGQSMIADQPTTLEEIEDEVQLWGIAKILAEKSIFLRNQTPGVVVEGWLYKKASTRMSISNWNRRWFILDKDGVYYLKGGVLQENGNRAAAAGSAGSSKVGGLERVKVCDIVLCTVREVNEKAKGSSTSCRFCFEILGPNNRPFMLQASGPNERKMWVEGIRSCVEQQLVSGNMPPAQNVRMSRYDSADFEDPSDMLEDGAEAGEDAQDSPTGAGASFSGSGGVMASAAGERNPLVQDILATNPTCADCSAPDPDWVSLNLGILLCIECSGVHRSLGVHLSKVRSLRLDQISDSEAKLILALGNRQANAIWESGLGSQKGWKKPSPENERRVKEEWIKSKYMWKGFLEYDARDGRDEEDRLVKFSVDMFESARRGNVVGLATALAKGANVDWKNSHEAGKTALHICVASEPLEARDSWRGIECAELLLQSGARMDVLDDHGLGVLDTAVYHNAGREMVEYLTARTAQR